MSTNPTNVTDPVVVSPNAGVIDTLQSIARYLGVLITFSIAMAGFVKVHDFADAATYIHQNGGQAVAAIAGLIAICTAAYGSYKSWKRGKQVATVAANPQVPDEVAKLKS